jgi:putative molybdopterin biosynthesis protein
VSKPFLDTREAAQYLGINEKQIYTLINDRKLPGTKITGKWLFPRHLIDRWVEGHVANVPEGHPFLDRAQGLLLIAGSDDLLLSRLISLYRERFPNTIPLQSKAGSTEGLLALKRGLCHIACVHLINPGDDDYNTSHLRENFGDNVIAVVFARRQQGIILPAGNPEAISSLNDIIERDIRWISRKTGTGTRLLQDRLTDSLGSGSSPFDTDLTSDSHMEVALAVHRGDAGAGLGIKAVAALTGLDFLPLSEERFDLAIRKDIFFSDQVQDLLGLLRHGEIRKVAAELRGYDISDAGKILAVA